MSTIASGSKKVEQKQHAKANEKPEPQAINTRPGANLDDGSETDAELRRKWDEAKAAALAMIRKDKNDKRGILTKAEAANRAATEITGYSPAERQAEEPAGKPKTSKINTSREKKPAVWHKFPKEFATSLNPEQPDITLALILNGLAFWMYVAGKGRRPKDYCYRSVRGLMADHPYLSKGAIEHALERGEEKLKGDFTIIRGAKTLRFQLSKALIKRVRAKPQLMFRIADAVNYGQDKAVLIANLKWQLKERNTCWVDDDGNEFYEFSPTKLSQVDPFTEAPPILPFSRWKISRLLDELCEDDEVFVQCPSLSTYYGLASEMVPVASASEGQHGAERDSDGAERDTRVAERDDLPCVVSNYMVMEDSKDIPPHTETASPSVCGDMASPGLRQIQAECNKALVALGQKQKDKAGARRTFLTVHPSQLPYDIISHPADDLPYDAIVRDSCGHRYTRKRQICEAVDLIAQMWKIQKFPYTAKDKKDLGMLFWENPEFTPDDFDEIQNWLPTNRIGVASKEDFKTKPGEWDCFHLARRIRNASALLKYLPELIREICTYSVEWEEGEMIRTTYIPDNWEGLVEYYETKKKPMPVIVSEQSSNPAMEMVA